MDERRTGTRDQIRSVALELFAEQGYDKASLREIAERLGVTKAALYYHFKTKEEILVSILRDLLAEVDDLVRWGQAQPTSAATRQEVLRRYSRLLSTRDVQITRLLQENQCSIRALPIGAEMHEHLGQLTQVLADADLPLVDQMRARLSLIALHVGVFVTRDLAASEQDRRDAALRIAIELANG
ncbi:TetR/AcrR family transcriptional regulator [Frankia sp. Cppng1_Ct_nod]|uniref:TetR/AcrR family transcriptional regulator n=1 Tax=Frankia sp. Cppng1_Ct_nod TaxID=2897162 RepID=UPI002023F6B8|nr:TetR/AcrR family transcriptional regulator [Frankia sp. Cppng1_Ct_nod]